jgi:very-short-patch-repair endonuclease
VGLSRILGVNKGANHNVWYNRIAQMSVDFVICTRDGAVLTVIELDDSSHGRMNRPEADAKKDKALAAAGIPIIRWNVKAIPDEGTIQRALASGYALR